jgi:NADH:ubiquinone oxidoreductase subunit
MIRDWTMGATIGTRLMIWWKGELVGKDGFGNKYYREKNGRRRWVVYAGAPDASAVPADWHGWLHHTVDEPPSGDKAVIPWERAHEPNPTGSPKAYHPAGSLLTGGPRAGATGDYEAWRPEQAD